MSKKLIWIISGVTAAVGIAVAAFFLLFSSSKILKMIPADSELVMTFNINKLVESTGCEISGEEVKLTPEIEKFIDDLLGKKDKKEFNEGLENLVKANECFDLDQIAQIGNPSNGWEYYTLLSVKDKEKAIELLENIFKTYDSEKDSFVNASFEKEGDYDVAKINSTEYIVIDDDYCWVYTSDFGIDSWEEVQNIDESDAIKAIEELKKKADKESIADVSYKNDVLDGDGVFALLYDSKGSDFNDNMNSLFGKYWKNTYDEVKVGVEIILDDAIAEMKVQLYNKEGDKIEQHPMLQNINSDFAKYITKDDFCAGAVAIDPKFIKDLIEESGEHIDDDAEEILSSLKGTMSFAAGIKDFKKLQEGDPSGITFMAMAEMSKNKADELIQILAKNANGRDVIYNGSTIEFNIDGFTFEIGSKDGYIYIANRPIKEKGNELIPASFFDEKQYAIKYILSKDNDISKFFELSEDITSECILDDEGCLSYKVDFGNIGDAKGLPDFFIKKAYEIYSNKSKRRELEEWGESTVNYYYGNPFGGHAVEIDDSSYYYGYEDSYPAVDSVAVDTAYSYDYDYYY